jgi:hypothetical protein
MPEIRRTSVSSIALRQYVFNVGHSPFAHNYLVFYDDDGNIAGQFHGLAQDPTGSFKLLGRSSDYLTVVPDDRQGLYRYEQLEQHKGLEASGNRSGPGRFPEREPAQTAAIILRNLE